LLECRMVAKAFPAEVTQRIFGRYTPAFRIVLCGQD
jgi:hypothetical protein